MYDFISIHCLKYLISSNIIINFDFLNIHCLHLFIFINNSYKYNELVTTIMNIKYDVSM